MSITNFFSTILRVACLTTFIGISTQTTVFAGPEILPRALPTPVPTPRPTVRKLDQQQPTTHDAINRASAEELIPFSPGWWAREQAIDDKLKKSITICRGC